jgi:hypothetical protein
MWKSVGEISTTIYYARARDSSRFLRQHGYLGLLEWNTCTCLLPAHKMEEDEVYKVYESSKIR